ncbi:MAG: hypothetical protein JWO02_3297 [Solirubrobacterales bacterium]|nr:hypothetical protein [Solirubrobacterales bacterium]
MTTPSAPQHAGFGDQREVGEVEEAVEGPHAEEGDDHGLVDRAAHPFRARSAGDALVAGDHADEEPEHEVLEEHREDEVRGEDELGEVVAEHAVREPEVPRRDDVVDDLHQGQAEEREHWQAHGHRHDARDDQGAHLLDPEHRHRVELVADLARAEVGRHGAADDAREDHGRDPGRDLAAPEDKDAARDPLADPEVDEQDPEQQDPVADHVDAVRDDERDEAAPHGERELDDRVAEPGEGRPDGLADDAQRERSHGARVLRALVGRGALDQLAQAAPVWVALGNVILHRHPCSSPLGA